MVTLPLFPEPYPNELFYSVLARYKVRCGLLPDKLLLEDVFKKKSIVASAEMPNGFSRAVENIKPLPRLHAKDIISRHTLFPLYTAFSESKTREKILAQMLACENNTYTTSLGIATCSLRQNNYFRYCPICVNQQLEICGEPYWDRRWFGLFTNCCPIHGVNLVATSQAIHSTSRHRFLPILEELTANAMLHGNPKSACWQDHLIAKASMHLIQNQSQFRFAQLTHFYYQIAVKRNLNRGKYLSQSDISYFVKCFWSWRWLKQLGFKEDYFERNLATLFRKQRKQHIYVMHVIAALPFFTGDLSSWWDALKSSPTTPAKKPDEHDKVSHHSFDTLQIWKDEWLVQLQQHGPKAARFASNSNERLYTALYRADRQWLLQINQLYKVRRKQSQIRVSWQKRDLTTCKLLFWVLYNEDDIYSPRRSKRWFLSCLPNSATIEKNLYRLPLTNSFLQAYSESHHEYQCRRLIQSTRSLAAKQKRAQRWQLYRTARINTQRAISSVVSITCSWCIDWLIRNIK